jgi:hypothetical protein
VIQEKKVDIYDIAILKADSATALLGWLNDNGYAVSKDAEGVIDSYTNKGGFYFIANKIDLANVYGNVTFTENDNACADYIARMYESSRFFASITDVDYAVSFVMGEESGGSDVAPVVPADCVGASHDAVVALYQLKSGVATPLKIAFKPERPFYPMEMTSIVDQDVKVDVYVFSDKYLGDSTGIMTTRQMTEVPSGSTLFKDLKLKPAQNLMTYLIYNGPSIGLDRDSVFSEVKYDQNMDPNYVSPFQSAFDALAVALLVPFLVIYVWPISILPIVLGGLLGLMTRPKGKKAASKAKLAVYVALLILAESVFALFALGAGTLIMSFDMSYMLLPFFLLIIPMAAAQTIPAFVTTYLKWKFWKRAIAVVVVSALVFAVLMLSIMLLPMIMY